MTDRARNIRRRLTRALRAAMRLAAGRPMQWGRDDCALFHGDIERSVRGYDPCAAFRGRYTTQRGARRVLGVGGLAAAMRSAARRYKWRRIAPGKARIGDIGIVAAPGGAAVVRMLHRGEWIGRNECGWSMLPTSHVRLAWRIC